MFRTKVTLVAFICLPVLRTEQFSLRIYLLSKYSTKENFCKEQKAAPVGKRTEVKPALRQYGMPAAVELELFEMILSAFAVTSGGSGITGYAVDQAAAQPDGKGVLVIVFV